MMIFTPWANFGAKFEPFFFSRDLLLFLKMGNYLISLLPTPRITPNFDPNTTNQFLVRALTLLNNSCV
jgi:hypothetical protein